MVPLEDVISRVRKWPRRWQNEDGGFPTDDEGTSSCTWTTAGLLWSLALSGESFDQEYVKRALYYLIGNQNPDGGNPVVKRGDPSVVDATAHLVCALSFAVEQIQDPAMEKSLSAAVNSLLYTRLPGQGWQFLGTEGKCYIGSTSFALIALSVAKDKLPEEKRQEVARVINEIASYLLRIRNEDCGWGQFPGAVSRPAYTALVLWALRESRMAQETQVAESVRILKDSQRDNGSWADSIEMPSDYTLNRFATPYAIIALVKHGVGFDVGLLQKGVSNLLRSYEPEKGCFHFQDTDIRSWPTRDGLLALSVLATQLSWKHITQLIAQRDELEKRIQTLEQSEQESLKEFIKNNANLFGFFKWATCSMLLIVILLSIWFSSILLGLTELQIGIIATVAVAIWGAIVALIATKKLS